MGSKKLWAESGTKSNLWGQMALLFVWVTLNETQIFKLRNKLSIDFKLVNSNVSKCLHQNMILFADICKKLTYCIQRKCKELR
jgi:hypothetical protein